MSPVHLWLVRAHGRWPLPTVRPAVGRDRFCCSAAGAALAGPLADHHGGGPTFLVVTAALGIALAYALLRRHTLPATS